MSRPLRNSARALAALLLTLTVLCATPHLPTAHAAGTSELEQWLIKLHTTARLMHTVAHPDDEDGGMLVLEGRGEGVTTLQLTLTRGEGGQNRTGSNLSDELGVLRTLELLAADRYYGVEQRFSRVADFGYSKSAQETLEKWHGAALADMVRVIRRFRPDVVVSRFQGTARDGHGNHQASGILTREAFRAAADPTRFPEQIAEGLQPWQARKLYLRGTGDYTLALDTGVQSPVLGMTFVQFAMNGLRHQLSQGAGEWQLSMRPHVSYYKLVDAASQQESGPPSGAPGTPGFGVQGQREHDFFEGLDTSLPGLASIVGPEESKVPFLRPALVDIQKRVDEATHLIPGPSSRLAGPLLAGLDQVKELIDRIDHSELSAGAKEDLLTSLRTKREQFEHAAALALHLELHVTVSPESKVAMVVPGQTVRLQAEIRNSGDEPFLVQQVALELPQGWATTPVWMKPVQLKPGQSETVPFTVKVPPNAELTRPYWHRDNAETEDVYQIDDPRYQTLPLPPPPVHANAVYAFGGHHGTVRAVARAGTAENSPPLAVVPAFSLLLDPRTQVIAADSEAPTTVSVQVHGYVPGAGTVRLQPPQGWRAVPESVPVKFDRGGEEKKVSFKVIPPGSYPPGKHRVRAELDANGREYAEGFTVVTGEDLGTFYYYQPAVQQLSVVNVKIPNLRIGYVMGAGDDIPTVLRGLGMNVRLLSAETIAGGDLSQYDTIVLGIRAYDTRPDVREHNQRLLDYVARGGTLLVQYNTNPEQFNAGNYTPYPAELSHDRVSVEEAPVTLLEPYDRIFRSPNVITEKDFQGWVQERGLYFMDQWDDHYRPLLSSADPGEPAREGGLLRARFGRGTYIYTGYAFFRQLPNGVPGATRLYLNLLNAGHGR